jgi:hypothetical protein
MTSAIDIANRALDEAMSRGQITSFSDNTPEAAAARKFYEPVRDQVMRAARWRFMQKVATAGMLKAAPGTTENPNATEGVWTNATPPPPWLYTYQYPADAIAIWRVLPQPGLGYTGLPLFGTALGAPTAWALADMPGSPWQVANDQDADGNDMRVVLANVPQALIQYGRLVADPNLWDPIFTEAVVQALAGKMAGSVSGKVELAMQKMQLANMAIMTARAGDGNEALTVNDRAPDWLTVRSNAPAMVVGSVWAPYGPLFGVA